jgi:hypothetical protein
VGTASWESKLELLHSCVPKLELGNKVEKSAFSDRLLGACPRTQNQPFGATQFPSLPSSDVGTASWESKLELLHSCVPKLELGNKVEKSAFSDKLLGADRFFICDRFGFDLKNRLC